MNENNISHKTKQAIEEMRQMNMRANFQKENGNSYQKSQKNAENISDNNKNFADSQNETNKSDIPRKDFINTKKPTFNSFFDGIGLPFSSLLSGDKDTALIIGLLLILMSEKSDKILLFALIYILI